MKDKDKLIRDQIMQGAQKQKSEIFKYLSLSGQLGLVMAASITISFLVVSYLIKRYDLDSIWLAVAVIFGVGSGMAGSYKLLKKILNSNEKRH